MEFGCPCSPHPCSEPIRAIRRSVICRAVASPINNRINEILNRIGDDEEYDFIFDANQGNIVYAKDDFDLTDRILEELQKD